MQSAINMSKLFISCGSSRSGRIPHSEAKFRTEDQMWPIVAKGSNNLTLTDVGLKQSQEVDQHSLIRAWLLEPALGWKKQKPQLRMVWTVKTIVLIISHKKRSRGRVLQGLVNPVAHRSSRPQFLSRLPFCPFQHMSFCELMTTALVPLCHTQTQ